MSQRPHAVDAASMNSFDLSIKYDAESQKSSMRGAPNFASTTMDGKNFKNALGADAQLEPGLISTDSDFEAEEKNAGWGQSHLLNLPQA
jgi:hypothetical protein